MSITITEEVTTTVERELFVPKDFMKAITLECQGMECQGQPCSACILGGPGRGNLKAIIESIDK